MKRILTKHSYIPMYVGADQTSIPGALLSPTINKPNSQHVIIYEPDTSLDDELIDSYLQTIGLFQENDTIEIQKLKAAINKLQ